MIPRSKKIDQFTALARDLRRALAPYGVIRSDWQSNAETLAGVNARGNELATRSGLIAGIFSWRTMMPRWGQDDIALIFLNNGADLWFLRTNQVGGFDPTIEPIPPTALFGLIPGVSRVALRLARSFAVPISGALVGYTVLALLAIAGVGIIYGRQSGLVEARFRVDHPVKAVLNLIKLFFVPVLVEELIFSGGVAAPPHGGRTNPSLARLGRPELGPVCAVPRGVWAIASQSRSRALRSPLFAYRDLGGVCIDPPLRLDGVNAGGHSGALGGGGLLALRVGRPTAVAGQDRRHAHLRCETGA